MADVMGKLKGIRGIVLLLCLIIVIVGWILIISSGRKTNRDEDWCGMFGVVIVILNCVMYFFDLTAVGPLAGTLMLAIIDYFTIGAHGHDHLRNHDTPLTGYILVIIACVASFCAFSVSMGKPDTSNKLALAGLIAAILLVVGNFFLWIRHKATGHRPYFSPVFLALVYAAGTLGGLQPAQDLAFFGAAFTLHRWWIVMIADGDGLVTFAAILIVVAIFIIIILKSIELAQGSGSSFQGGKAKSIMGIFLIVCFVFALLGWILILASGRKTSKSEDWCGTFGLAIVILNLCQFFLSLPALGPVAGALALGTGGGVPLLDNFTIWAHGHDAHVHRNNDHGLPLTGYIFLLFGVLGSFAAFPVSVSKPNLKDRFTLVAVIVGILLFIGNLFLWFDHRGVGHRWLISPFFIALVYIAGNLWQVSPAVDLAFYAVGFVLHFYWVTMLHAHDAAEFGLILVNVAFLLIIIVYCIQSAKGGKPQ